MATRADVLALDRQLEVERLFAELFRERDLRREEFLERALALRQRVQAILPDGCGVRVRHLVGQRVDEQIGGRLGDEVFLLPLRAQEAPLDEIVDDGRARRLCADTVDILELLLRLGILDVFMDFLHASEQRRRREARGRLRDALLDLALRVGDAIALLHRGQRAVCLIRLALFLRLILFLARGLPRFRLIHDLPAGIALRAAARGEKLLLVGDLDLCLVVDMVRVELREVAARDERVEVALRRGQRLRVHAHCRRDDGMVRGDFLIVPGAALARRVRARCPGRKLRPLRLPQIRKDGLRLAELVERQILAVRARVRRELLLVELLRRIEHELRLVAEPLAREHLQTREGKGQRRALLLLRARVARDGTLARRLGKRMEHLLRHRLVDEAVLAVEPRDGVARLPLRDEAAVRMRERRLDRVVIDGLEMLDLPLAPHDERERRRLDAADGQHEPRMTRAPRRERIGAREIHADEPVRAGASERRLLERIERRIVAQMRVRALDALFVECVEQDALHGLLVAKIVEYLVDEQLALAVRVARMDDLVCLGDEIFHDGELLLAALRDIELPRLRQDGQILCAPPLVARIVLLRLRLTQDVTEEPRHNALASHEIAVMARDRPLQALRDLPPHTRLLGNIQTQHAHLSKNSARTRRFPISFYNISEPGKCSLAATPTGSPAYTAARHPRRVPAAARLRSFPAHANK